MEEDSAIARPVIGIAGGVGSGKSTVARILGELGCVVADSDAMGRAALLDATIRDTLVDWWGPDILGEDGAIDRARVARIVFTDAGQRRRLESLVHPWIEQRRLALFDAAPPDAKALVIDAPLLFEAGLDRVCDAVVFVDTDRDSRADRLRTSRGWDLEELTRREDSQLPLDEKRARSDHVVINNGDLHELSDQVRRILNKLT